MNAITALKLAIESWDGISGYDSQCGDVNERGLYAARFDGPFRADEILDTIGEECGPLEGVEALIELEGAIYTVNDIGQKNIAFYMDKRELDSDWVGAAAPEMLKALKELTLFMDMAFTAEGDTFGFHHNDATDALISAKRAIAKAEGRK